MGSGIDKKPDGCKPVGFCGIGLILLLAAVFIHNPDREMGAIRINTITPGERIETAEKAGSGEKAKPVKGPKPATVLTNPPLKHTIVS